MTLSFPRGSTIERANEQLSKAVFGPYTEGTNQVAGVLSPFGLSLLTFTPPQLWPAVLGTIYMQGTYKGVVDAPKHYLEAMKLYARAATEGARVAVG